jgi:hypothetical protein
MVFHKATNYYFGENEFKATVIQQLAPEFFQYQK